MTTGPGLVTRLHLMQRFGPLIQSYFGNPIERWLTALAIAAVAGLVLYLVKVAGGRRLSALAARTVTEVDDLAAELLARTRFYFIIALAFRAGSVALVLSDDVLDSIRKATAIAVLLQIAVWGTTLIGFWLRKWSRGRGGEAASSATINAIGLMARGALWAMIALLALRNVLDYDIAPLVAGLGIGGVAIALAVQNVLGDLFAALSIVLDKPFDVGDVIAVDTFTGTVENIGLKTTRVRAIGGEQVVFSNADLLRSRVRNLKRMTSRRSIFNVGITYDTPPDRVARVPALIRGIVEATPNARFERAHFAHFGPSSLDFEVVFHVDDPDFGLFMDAQQAINIALLERFNEERIDFAFPTQTVINLSRDAPRSAEDSADGGEPPEPRPGA